MEDAIKKIVTTFLQSSRGKENLDSKSFQKMVSSNLGTIMENAQDKEAVDKVMGDLDSNNDGEVDFTEFIILVGALTVACNDFFLEYNEKQEKK
uniref:S100 calcium binding protein T n=1 Tax=Tetraodon nigroviridis TaxID=99883 RepID=H3C059_TETNG